MTSQIKGCVWRLHADRGTYVEPSVPTLLTDFLTRAAVAASCAGGATASSARVPRRQNAGSEGQRSRLR